MSTTSPARFDNVSVECKANIYFDGKVVSHAVIFPDGTRKTIGIMYPGSYTFSTGAPERMEIIAGSCSVKIAGQPEQKKYAQGTFFDVPGNSAFDISVDEGVLEYVCSYM